MSTQHTVEQRFEQGPTIHDEEYAHEIHEISPEGEPEHPVTTPERIWLLLLIVSAVLAGGAFIIGAAFNFAFGVVLFGIAFIALLFNPVFLAGWLRIGERARARRRLHIQRESRTIRSQDAPR